MPQIIVTTRENEVKTLEAKIGQSVMEVIRDGGIDEVLALCGGCCSCATCQVYVDTEFLGLLTPVSPDEDDLLDSSSQRRENSRLSCQLRVTAALDGLKVTIAEDD